MRLEPVVARATIVADAVSASLRVSVTVHSELDVDVYRLRRKDSRPDLVVRAFGPDVERASVDAVAQVLHRLADTRFPAERCAADSPVLSIGDGRHLLVTEYVEPSPAPSAGFVIAWCAGLLGRLASRPGGDLPDGGGWHRLGSTPSREIDEALRIGGQNGSSVMQLVDALAAADDGAGLPEALIHADLTPPNVVPRGDEPPVVVDWIGVGRGPRVWPLAFLLFAAGPRAAQRTLERYVHWTPLSDEERHRLPGIMIARPLTLDLWSVGYERMTPRQATARFHGHPARVEAVTAALGG